MTSSGRIGNRFHGMDDRAFAAGAQAAAGFAHNARAGEVLSPRGAKLERVDAIGEA
jgi:hypothetical protein